jgi:hypothetical protein
MHRREISRKVTHSFQPKPISGLHPFILEIIRRAEFMPSAEPAPVIELEPDRPSYEVRVIDIQRAVAKKWEVRVIDLLSARRTAEIVEPRQISCVLCKLLTSRSLPDIGRRTGGRDHTTILHSIRKYQWLFDRLGRELNPTDYLSVWVNRAHELVTEQ